MFRSTGDVTYKENMGNIHRIWFYKSEGNKRLRRPKCRWKNKVFMWLNTVILHCKETLFIENSYKQGNTRQNMFNATFRRVRELLLLWKSNQHYIFVCVCVCVCLGAWACACVCVHVAMLIQRATRMPLWHHHIFQHYLINDMIFEKKKLLNIKCVFWFSLHLFSKTFLILRRI